MKEFFFSLRAAYCFLAGLVLVFFAGSLLTGITSIDRVFRRMNVLSFADLPAHLSSHPLVIFWIFLLFFFGAGLFVNTLCCTYRQLPYLKKKGGAGARQRRGMTYIHLVVILVIACHAIDIVLVERHLSKKILPMQTIAMGDYQLRLDGVDYITDRTFITENAGGRVRKTVTIPKASFSTEGNRAEVSLYRDGLLLKRGTLRMFSPLYYKGTFFFLDGFFIGHGQSSVGVLLHYAFNPLVRPFFLIYILLFTLLFRQFYQNRYRSCRETCEDCEA
ncbi:hypothetical protein [Desulfotalea psychrophila]|uniref:ResB-like domain-containing protein n=1 Tax=Desulfotalea psychrophila (strain LSv54 / DSM 12343) TaxID=177439 RepID=Q6AIX5_DESPS|nr:hypothetical protein [Desulfotalea psychrophila]CAG37705.1 unknown protein [Desulfotalea psychrophila LSv54]